MYKLIAIYYAVTAVPAMAVGVRRLHDTGRSGWWMLVSLIPFAGGIRLILEIRWITQGSDFHIKARFVLYIAGILAFLLYGGLLLARKGRLRLANYVLMAASVCNVILTLWSMTTSYGFFLQERPDHFVDELRIIVPLPAMPKRKRESDSSDKR